VLDTESGALELFSRARGDDPARDLAAERAGDARALAERLMQRRLELGRAAGEDAGEIPADELRALRELGYAGD
jgi:hypothetical protein